MTDDRPLPHDSDLRMFVESVRTPDPRRLDYLRWLAEREGRTLGPPSGACSEAGPPIVAAPAYSGRA